ncbi:MAG TPA: hypothetical protein VFH56_14365 [Acidimicrobiales bacterium]|nr:hypothetical protein [Acidimicrobiales bacterium]
MGRYVDPTRWEDMLGAAIAILLTLVSVGALVVWVVLKLTGYAD